MTELTRRLMLGASGAALLGVSGATGSILFSGPPPPVPSGPTGISQNPSSLSILKNQPGNAILAALAEIGGTGAGVAFSVTGNPNLVVSGSSLKTVASPTFVAGVNETYRLHVTDSGGTFDDPADRTLVIAAGPSNVIATPATLFNTSALGTLAADLAGSGGTAPLAWQIANSPDNFSGYLNISSPGATSQLTLNSAGVGNLVAGTPLTGKVIVTDAGGNSFTSATISIAVNNAATAPTGVSTNPSSLTIRSDQAGSATIAALTEQGGSGVGVSFNVIGNANLTVSGTNLNTVASPSFTPGQNQTYFLSVTDSAGTYTDTNPRTLTVLAVPTGINTNPPNVTALANATNPTVLASLAEQGGTGASVVFGVIGNSNLDVSGSNLIVKAGATFAPGVNQTFKLSVSDTGGTFTDAVNRTLTVPAGPSAVVLSGNSVPDNAQPGNLVSTIGITGGTTPYAFAYTGGNNTNFNISPLSGSSSTLVVSNTGPGAIGNQSVNIQVTDAAGLTATSGPTTITVVDHTASSLITNLSVKNTGGSTQTSPFVTKIFGQGFVKGAMLVGGLNTYPVFKIGATVLSYSVGSEVFWSDGSLKWAAFMLLIPTGNNIAAAGTLSVDIYNGGSKPAASSRSAADFSTGGHVYQVEMDLAAGGSGTYIASLNDGFATGQVCTYMDGGAGKVWRVDAAAKQGGVADPQLGVYFYCAALNNASGTLGGLRINPRVKNGWIDVGSKRMIMFSRLQLTDNGSLILDPWANSTGKAPVQFSWLNNTGGTGTSAKFSVPSASPGVGLFAGINNSGYGCMVSSTGTLPANLAANTPYFLRYGQTANTIMLNRDSLLAQAGTLSPTYGLVGGSDAGTGVHTLTPMPFVCWGGSLFVLPMNGLWNYQQGAGSFAADDTCRVIPNKTYLHSTRLHPPYDLSVGASTQSAISYIMNGTGNTQIDQTQTSTGERPEIGPESNFAALYYVNQDDGSETVIRVLGLTQGHFSTCLRMSTTGTIFNGINDNNYANIPQPSGNTGSQFRFFIDACQGGSTIPDVPTVNIQGTYAEFVGAHLSNFSHPAHLIFGEPQFYDLAMERANNSVYNRIQGNPPTATANNFNPGGNQRNVIVNGVTYEGIQFGIAANFRADAWNIRDLAWGLSLTPDLAHSYDGADYKSLWTDSLNASYNAINAWRAMYPTGFAITNGIWGYQTTGQQSDWQFGFGRFVGAIAYGACEISGAKTWLDMSVLRPAHTYNRGLADGNPWPFFNNVGYKSSCRISTQTYPTDYISQDADLATTNGVVLTCTINVPDLNFVYAPSGSKVGPSYVPNVNDVFRFASTDGTLPGFSLDTPYYVISVSGSTLRLSLTQGGAAVVPTGTKTAATNVEGYSINNGVGSMPVGPSADSYGCIVAGYLNWLTALGISVDSGLFAAANQQLQYLATNNKTTYTPKTNPKYTFASSF